MGEIRSKINYEEVKRKAQKDTLKDLIIIFIATFFLLLLCIFIIASFSPIRTILIILIYVLLHIGIYYLLYVSNIEEKSIDAYIEKYLSTDKLTQVTPKDTCPLNLSKYDIKYYAITSKKFNIIKIYIHSINSFHHY